MMMSVLNNPIDPLFEIQHDDEDMDFIHFDEFESVTESDMQMGRDVARSATFIEFAPLRYYEKAVQIFRTLINEGINFPMLQKMIIPGGFDDDEELWARILQQVPHLQDIKIDNGSNMEYSCDLESILIALERGQSASGRDCPCITIETRADYLEDYVYGSQSHGLDVCPLNVVELRLREFDTAEHEIDLAAISFFSKLRRLHLDTNFQFETEPLVVSLGSCTSLTYLTFTARTDFIRDAGHLVDLTTRAKIKREQLNRAGIISVVTCLSVDKLLVNNTNFDKFLSAVQEFGLDNPTIYQLTLDLWIEDYTYSEIYGVMGFDAMFYNMMSAFKRVKIVQLFGNWNCMSNGSLLAGIGLNCREVVWLSLIDSDRSTSLVVDVPRVSGLIDLLTSSFHPFVMFPSVIRLRVAIDRDTNFTSNNLQEFMEQHFPQSHNHPGVTGLRSIYR